jgi:hypothetical protein
MDNNVVIIQSSLLFGIIVILVIVGIAMNYNSFKNCKKDSEEFSPLGFASNCPENKIPDSSHLRVEGCGPGCWMLKNNKNKEHFKVDGKRNCTTDRIPEIRQHLPIGHLSTMGSPLIGQSSCTSGVNGVQKLENKNPYGELVKNGEINQFTQSYAACGFGSDNIFDKEQL